LEKHRAIVYVDRLFNCADGKTAHGLVRYSNKYKISCVVDTTLSEGDAGQKLDGINRDIPLYNDLKRAFELTQADTFIVGAVSDVGVLPDGYGKAVKYALTNGLNVVSGLHQFLSDDPVFSKLAKESGCNIIDVRKIYRDYKRFYTGEIKKVKSFRVAMIGTDSAIGKRTIAIMLNEELLNRGRKSDMIFTGQTGWLQGWPHGLVLDAMINDFVAGGIEGEILGSWKDGQPEYMIIEGQGSLVHPFFPGGFEILAAGRVDGFILIDAPKRKSLDGFPDYPMPDPRKVVKIAELLTDKPLLGIGINRENMDEDDIKMSIERFSKIFKVPVFEPISMGVDEIVDILEDLNE
jgi:uncharacterized NAD-dependent epimerase/dehydratase family protein